MTIRQLDTWVLDVYLDEAGWDGQHQHIYFTTKRDAEAAGRLIEARVRERVGDGDQTLDWSVYKITPFASFHDRPGDLAKIANGYAEEWLEGLDLDPEDACTRCGHSSESHGGGDEDGEYPDLPCDECDCDRYSDEEQ